MPSGLAVAAGGSLLGAISGAGGSSSSSTRDVAPTTSQERYLQQQSLNNYLSQQGLSDQFENSINDGSAQGVQDASRNSLQQILSGAAFNMSPEQQAQINAIRDNTIQSGTQDITDYANKGLSTATNNAGVRGLRGQAAAQLQGDVLNSANKAYGGLVNQANLTASQQALQVPYQQAQLQGSLANSNSTLQNQLQQQAISNRSNLQNPALMGYLQNERMGSAGTTNTQQGNIGSAIGGALGGAGSLLGAYGKANEAGLFYEGGRVPDKKWDQKDHQDFKKGYLGGENLSESLQNIRNFLTGNSNQEQQQQPRNFAHGGRIPGQPLVSGNHPVNDKQKAWLSPNEIVIPNSHSEHPDLAIAYVKHLFKKEKETAAM